MIEQAIRLGDVHRATETDPSQGEQYQLLPYMDNVPKIEQTDPSEGAGQSVCGDTSESHGVESRL